jgi:hypothetical protein
MLISPFARCARKYLEKNPQDDWLYIACQTDHDFNGELLHWMVHQPNCDKAVALSIYWYQGARWYAQFDTVNELRTKEEQRSFKLIRIIESKYLAGFYKKHELEFNPQNDCLTSSSKSSGYDWTNDYQDKPIKHPVPELMQMPLKGKKVDFFGERYKNWDEGLPTGMWQKIESTLESPVRYVFQSILVGAVHITMSKLNLLKSPSYYEP